MESGQLVFKQSVVSSRDDGISKFYLSHNSLWNSAHREIAERKGRAATEILVPCCTLRRLIQEYGVPFYCKIDIEGNDIIALESLKDSRDLPLYISVETECIGDNSHPEEVTFSTLDMLYKIGYRKFKLVDQATLTVLEDKPFYGQKAWSRNFCDDYFYADKILGLKGRFLQYFPNSSGPFGEDLNGVWRDYESAKTLIKMHSDAQRKLGLEVWSFWCDWHATF